MALPANESEFIQQFRMQVGQRLNSLQHTLNKSGDTDSVAILEIARIFIMDGAINDINPEALLKFVNERQKHLPGLMEHIGGEL